MRSARQRNVMQSISCLDFDGKSYYFSICNLNDFDIPFPLSLVWDNTFSFASTLLLESY